MQKLKDHIVQKNSTISAFYKTLLLEASDIKSTLSTFKWLSGGKLWSSSGSLTFSAKEVASWNC